MISTDTYPELDQAHIDALFSAARGMAGDAFSLVESLSERDPGPALHPILEFLPRKYLPRYDLSFAERFATAMITVAWKLTEPNHVYSLACTAEELALKYLLDMAADGRSDEQFEELADVLFEDDSFLVLWDPSQDGIEDLRRDASSPAASLAFNDWFEPFNASEQVHPFVQPGPETFRLLWSDAATGDEDPEDPVTEVFIALGEDWLEVPDQVADQIPGVLEETASAMFPDRPSGQRLSAAERQQVYESAAEDVRMILQAARQDDDTAYDVWLITQQGGHDRSRYRLYAQLPLEEALTMRKVERMGEYRGITDVEVRVYPESHVFDRLVRELTPRPKPG